MMTEAQRQTLQERYCRHSQAPLRAESLRCGVHSPDDAVRANVRSARRQAKGTLILWDDHLAFLAHRGASVGLVLLLVLGLLAWIVVCTALVLWSGRESWIFPAVGGIAFLFGLNRLSKRKLDLANETKVKMAAEARHSLLIPRQDIEGVEIIEASGYLGCTCMRLTFHDRQEDRAMVAVVMADPGHTGGTRDFPASGWCTDIQA